MAKESQADILNKIFILLDQTLGEVKKKNKAVGESNVPKGAGVVNANDISVKAVGDALSVISSAVPKLAKISKETYDNIAYGIEKIAGAINSFKMDKGALAGVNNMVSAFVQIHNVISGMSENFIKSILSLNPIKAWILGRRLGRFYGIIAKGMTAAFVKQLVDIINQVPPNRYVQSKTFKERLVNFGLMMAALLQIKEKQIMQLWMMGLFLGPKSGAAIGGFFKALIDSMIGNDKDSVKKAEAAAKMALSVATLVGTLTLSLVALVILSKTSDGKDLAIGIGLLLGVVGFALGIIKLLGSEWFKREKNKGLQGTKDIVLLIGGLTLSLAVLVLVAKKTKWTDIVQGIMMLTAVMAFAIGILLVLGKSSFKKEALEGLESLGEITLLILGMTISLTVVTYVAKKTKWTDVVQGIIMLGAIVAFAIGIIWVLSRDSFQKNAIKGILGVGAIVLAIVGLSFAMNLFADYLKKMDGISLKGIIKGTVMMGAMIMGVVAGIFALGAFLSGPQALIFWYGFAAIESISIAIASISGAMLLFVELLNKVNQLDQNAINDAVKKLVDPGEGNKSMLGCLKTIIVNLMKFNKDQAKNVKRIGKALKPVMEALSMFVDVIQKMAKMEILDHYDENGKPVYRKMKETEFVTAATNLITAFTAFINNLTTGLDTLTNLDGTKKILKTLFPRNKKRSGGIGNVIRALSDFVDVIQKMASLNVPDKWDKDGNPIHYKKLENKDFINAAITLSLAFGIFVATLGTQFGTIDKNARKAIKKLSGPLQKLMTGITDFINPIMQLAAGHIQIGEKTYDISVDTLQSAAVGIVSVISAIIDPLLEISKKDIDYGVFKDIFKSCNGAIDFIKNAIEKINTKDFPQQSKDLISGITTIINYISTRKFVQSKENAGRFEDVMEDFVDGVKELERIQMKSFTKEFIDHSANLIKGLHKIFNFLQSTKYLATAKSNSVIFKDVMKNTATGINHIKPFLSATPKQIVDLANAMKQLDAELITKEEQRTKAIQSVATNFKDMASSINQLNESLSESMRISRLYDQMKSVTSGNIIAKGVSAAVEGAGVVANKVKEALSDNKTEEQQKTKEEAKQKDREEFANVIASAVSAALTAWSESHKDLTVQFSDSPEKIFGEVYNM